MGIAVSHPSYLIISRKYSPHSSKQHTNCLWGCSAVEDGENCHLSLLTINRVQLCPLYLGGPTSLNNCEVPMTSFGEKRTLGYTLHMVVFSKPGLKSTEYIAYKQA